MDFLPHESTLKQMGITMDFEGIRNATDVIDFQKKVLPPLHGIKDFDAYFEASSSKNTIDQV